ncbi:thioesterase family protein [Tistrella sp. BH-R2-4]|uniref:Thioesterase family protein n=1 Tax=Tistrella arctica TaxID=3133430 RepID=A0ABU9YRX8_9PROT
MQTGNQAGEDEMMAEDAGFEDIEAGRGVVVAGETDARGRMSAAAITDRITDGAVFVLSAAGLGRYALSEQGLRLKVLASAVEIDEAPAVGEAWRLGLQPVPAEEGAIGFAAELVDPLFGDLMARGLVEVILEDAEGEPVSFPDDIADRLADAATEAAAPDDSLPAGCGVVATRHCDIMGHMNVQFYGVAFEQATRLLTVGLGLPDGVVLKPTRSVIRFKAEQRLGDAFQVTTRPTMVAPDALAVTHELHNIETGALAASVEYVLIPITAATGATHPFDDETVETAAMLGAEVLAGIDIGPGPTPTEGVRVETYRGSIDPWHCDENGLLSQQALIDRFSSGAGQLLGAIGLSGERIQTDRIGTAAVEYRVRYEGPARNGDALVLESQIAGVRDKVLILRHRLVRPGEEATPLLEIDVVAVMLDLEQRRATRVPADVAERARGLLVETEASAG